MSKGSGEVIPEEPACKLCGYAENNALEYGEKITDPESGITAHYYCLIFSSGLCQQGNDSEGLYGFLPDDIIKESKRASRLKCMLCKQKGAAIGCNLTSCRRKFHLPCGIKLHCLFQFQGNFPSFCAEHRPVQLEARGRADSEPQTCVLCLEVIDDLSSFDALCSASCCDTFFHRSCIQQQALHSGLFFFRCPICNNNEKFQAEMLRMGIHIPERDASWERDENAFQDLLIQYQRCDIKRCQCAMGRDYNKANSKWEVTRCDCCGAAGTHLACAGLKSNQTDWFCYGCRPLLARSKSPHGKIGSPKLQLSFPSSPLDPEMECRDKSSFSPSHMRKEDAVPLFKHTDGKQGAHSATPPQSAYRRAMGNKDAPGYPVSSPEESSPLVGKVKSKCVRGLLDHQVNRMVRKSDKCKRTISHSLTDVLPLTKKHSSGHKKSKTKLT